MTNIEALRARMREAAVAVENAGDDLGLFSERHGEFQRLASPANVKALDAEITRLREDLGRVTRENEALSFDVDRAAKERDEARDNLHGLLAVIHRDGGHHTEAVGLRQSVQDAFLVWAALMSRAEAAEAALTKRDEEVAGMKKQVTSTALDALAADGQAHESYAAAMALHERLTAILDWCDLASDQPSTFNKQGVKLLQGPIFDAARKAVTDHAIYAPKEPPHAE